MNRTALSVVAAVWAIAVPSAVADLTAYVNNETGNSVDWTTAVLGKGGIINTDIDFETHPLGPLDPNHYDSLGVTLGVTGGFPGISFGAGPGQTNTGSTPTSSGEGLHPASNFLLADALGTFTISFDAPVIGVGLFTIDLFNPGDQPDGRNPVTIEVFDGPNGTGNSLGLFDSAQFNFQMNFLYFMGVSSTDNNIRSLVFNNPAGAGDDIGIDNIVFAVPAPGALALLGITGLMGTRRRRR